MPRIAQRVAPFGTTIFTAINELAAAHGALNLGQGKPDFPPVAAITERLAAAARDPAFQQYAPGQGTLALRTAIATHAQRFYDLTLDPAGGIIVTAGATEAIFAAVLGLVDQGDEVIVIEPFYDSYAPNISMAGATPVYVSLHPPTWTLDPTALRAAFTARTRAIIINTPHNPTGRVLTMDELTLIAELATEHDVTVIADEVYDHLLFGDAHHISIATLPGMFERTVTVGSAGKMFSVTGWKVGWVAGPPALIAGVNRAHQFITFAVNHPTQDAVAFALGLPESYWDDYRASYTSKRAILLAALEHAGLRPFAPEGSFFIMADFTGRFTGSSMEFVRHLITTVGIAAIPADALFSTEHAAVGNHYIRFAFCKTEEMLTDAATRLARL